MSTPSVTVKVLSSFVNATQPEEYELAILDTASDLVSKVLQKHQMMSRDPKLFYLTLDTIDISKNNITTPNPTSSVTLHDDSPIVTFLESQKSVGEQILVMHMRSGGLVKVYDACIMPGSYYKSLFISRKTTAINVISLLLSSYGLKTPAEDFILVEKNVETNETRNIEVHEYPLLIQQANNTVEIHLQKVGETNNQSNVLSPELLTFNNKRFRTNKAKSSTGLSRAPTYHGEEDLNDKSPNPMTRKDTLARLRDSFKELQKLRETDLEEYEKNVIKDSRKPELITSKNKSSKLYGTKARQERLQDLLSGKNISSRLSLFQDSSERTTPNLGSKVGNFKRAGSLSARSARDFATFRDSSDDDMQFFRKRLNSLKDQKSENKRNENDKIEEREIKKEEKSHKINQNDVENQTTKTKSQIPRPQIGSVGSMKRQLPQVPMMKDEDIKARRQILEKEAQKQLQQSQQHSLYYNKNNNNNKEEILAPSPTLSVSSTSSLSRKQYIAEIRQKQTHVPTQIKPPGSTTMTDVSKITKEISPRSVTRETNDKPSKTSQHWQKTSDIVIKNYPVSTSANQHVIKIKTRDVQCQSFENEWRPASKRIAESSPTLFEICGCCDLITLTFNRQTKAHPWGICCYEAQFPIKEANKLIEDLTQYRVPTGRKPAIGKRPGAFGGNSKILKYMKTVIAVDAVVENNEVALSQQGHMIEQGDYIIEVNGNVLLGQSPEQVQQVMQSQLTIQLLLARIKPLTSTHGSTSSINGSIDSNLHSREFKVHNNDIHSQLTHLQAKYDKLRNETTKNEHLIHELRALVVKKTNVNLVKSSQRMPSAQQSFQAIPLSQEEIISTV